MALSADFLWSVIEFNVNYKSRIDYSREVSIVGGPVWTVLELLKLGGELKRARKAIRMSRVPL